MLTGNVFVVDNLVACRIRLAIISQKNVSAAVSGSFYGWLRLSTNKTRSSADADKPERRV